MPRIGMNPNRDHTTDYRPARVTLAMLTFLPEESGYFEHRFESMRTSLASLITNTPQPYDLLVFDNASCPEVRAYLQNAHQANRIQYLVLSDRNVGKGGAWNMMLAGAPGEIIAYADSDVLFYPGWLVSRRRISTLLSHWCESTSPIQ